MSSVEIAEPGIYELDDQTYHADPVPSGSLSSTGVKTILRSPAHFRQSLGRPVVKHAYDVGHAVHAKVLGTGLQPVAYPDSVLAANGAASTRAAREWADAARAAGQVPLKAEVVAEVDAMAEAVLRHPIARALLEQAGRPEASAFAIDEQTGVWLRARPDFLPDPGEGRTILVDLKTADDADPRTFGRSVASFGYHTQDAHYQQVVRAARGDEDTAFVFVLVEKAAPWLVSVVELDEEARQVGRERVERAIDLYARCKAEDHWPGYPNQIAPVSLPKWAVYAHDEESAA